MTDTPTETPAVPSPTSAEPTVAEVSSKLDQVIGIVGQLLGGQPADRPPVDEDDKIRSTVKQEMDREKAKLKRDEEAKAARNKEVADAAKAAVDEKLKEKPPQEYRKIEEWHKWRYKEDR